MASRSANERREIYETRGGITNVIQGTSLKVNEANYDVDAIEINEENLIEILQPNDDPYMGMMKMSKNTLDIPQETMREKCTPADLRKPIHPCLKASTDWRDLFVSAADISQQKYAAIVFNEDAHTGAKRFHSGCELAANF